MSSKAKKTILIAVAAVCILVCVGSGLFLYQYYHGVQVESTLLERMKTGTAEISSAPAPSDQPEQDSGETPEESETDAAPSEEEPLMKTVRLPVDFAQLFREIVLSHSAESPGQFHFDRFHLLSFFNRSHCPLRYTPYTCNSLVTDRIRSITRL